MRTKSGTPLGCRYYNLSFRHLNRLADPLCHRLDALGAEDSAALKNCMELSAKSRIRDCLDGIQIDRRERWFGENGLEFLIRRGREMLLDVEEAPNDHFALEVQVSVLVDRIEPLREYDSRALIEPKGLIEKKYDSMWLDRESIVDSLEVKNRLLLPALMPTSALIPSANAGASRAGMPLGNAWRQDQSESGRSNLSLKTPSSSGRNAGT